MLLVYSKYTGKFPLSRFIFTASIFAICTIVLLYIMMANRVQQIEEEISEFDDVDDDYWYTDDDSDEEFDSGEIYDTTENTNRFPLLTEKEMSQLAERMKKRRDYAREACIRLGANVTQDPNGWEFLINKEHHLIWCNIFKAASTTWMYNFDLMAGYTLEEIQSGQPQQMARLRYPRPNATELIEAHSEPGSTAFLIVRHPFERLSSAFRDKLLSEPQGTLFSDLAEEIVMKYAKKKPKDKGFFHRIIPTFEQFVQYVLDQVANNKTLDIHWTPYTPFCTPCQFQFDIIIKLETFKEDQNYLVQKTGLRDILKPDWKNPGYKKWADEGKKTSEIIRDHFSQLTTGQVSQLYELYKFDFEIFNYTVDEYYEMARKEDTKS